MTDPASSSSIRARLVRAVVYVLVLFPLVYEVQWLWRKGPLIEPVPITPKNSPAEIITPPAPPTVPLPPQVTAVQEAPLPDAEAIDEPAPEPEPKTPPGPLPRKDMVKLERMLAAASPGGEVKQHKKLDTPPAPPPVSGKKSLETFRDCEQCPLMVVMPTSRFNMGSSEGNPWEQPRHTVNIRHRFAIGRYEISERMWAACVADEYCNKSGSGGPLPVVKVSWQDAQDYVKWLSDRTGRHYRLPTEAEWALAARGGTNTSRYWGPDRENQCLYANGADQSLKKASKKSKTEFADCNDRNPRRAAVGSYQPNAFSLRDTAGNVWEWVQDCWAPNYAGAPDDGSARTMQTCPEYVIRGGSWRMRPEALRSAERGHALPGQRSDDLGFRVAAE